MSKGRRKEKKAQRRVAGAGHRHETSRGRDTARFCRRFSRVIAVLEGSSRAGRREDERKKTKRAQGPAGGRRVSGVSPKAQTGKKPAVVVGLLPEKCGSADAAEAAAFSSGDISREPARSKWNPERAAMRYLCRGTAVNRPWRLPGRPEPPESEPSRTMI